MSRKQLRVWKVNDGLPQPWMWAVTLDGDDNFWMGGHAETWADAFADATQAMRHAAAEAGQ